MRLRESWPCRCSLWGPILVTSSDERSLATVPIPDVGARVVQLPERRILWRDNYSNLLGILK